MATIHAQSQIEPDSEIEEQPFDFDVDSWVKEATNLLREGWQQYERFEFRCDKGDSKYEPMSLGPIYERDLKSDIGGDDTPRW